MRVLAICFVDESAARRALDYLRQRYSLGPEDAAVATLAPEAGTENKGRRMLLAGRFRDERVAEVRTLIARLGGEVLHEVEERWTQPWPKAASAGSGPVH